MYSTAPVNDGALSTPELSFGVTDTLAMDSALLRIGHHLRRWSRRLPGCLAPVPRIKTLMDASSEIVSRHLLGHRWSQRIGT